MDYEAEPIDEIFLYAISILSKKLNKQQYDIVTNIMFNLYMGDTYGFDSSFDERFLPLVKMYWHSKGKNKFKTKINEYKEKVVRFKVYEGGKDKK